MTAALLFLFSSSSIRLSCSTVIAHPTSDQTFYCRLVTPGCSCSSPWGDVGFSYLLLHRPIPLRLRKAACDTKPGQTRGQRSSREARDSVTTIIHSEEGGGYKKTQVKGANDNAPKWPGQFSLPMPGRCRALLIPSCAATEGPARFSPGPFI